MESLFILSDKALHQPFIDDGILRPYHCKPPIYVPENVKRFSGVCPHCSRIGQISAYCLKCPPSLLFQIPITRYASTIRMYEGCYLPTPYRLDTLFYALHMQLYDAKDPDSVRRGYTTPLHPTQLLVPIYEQSDPTYLRLPNEPLPVIRFMDDTLDRSYPDINHPRRRIIHSLMTDDIGSLRVGAHYVPLLQEMIDEWKSAAKLIQAHINYLSDFLERNGPRLEVEALPALPAVAAIGNDDDDDDNDAPPEPRKKRAKAVVRNPQA
jgi:hypothetical protein